MIKITKSATVPDILQNTAAPTSVNNVCRNVYADQTVKAKLLSDQNCKCAYCECYLEGKSADVEHFRPKASYRIAQGMKRYTPGYYWLAYDWDNLLLSCQACNRAFKNDIFPLFDESQRDIAGKNISKEEPMILNPAKDDLAKHIEFNRYIIRPILHNGHLDFKGSCTINLFCLNTRPVLLNARKRRWEEYENVEKNLDLATI
jgi:uncharacterized protein (TIGR02646 family)